jgi:hypothetical protein
VNASYICEGTVGPAAIGRIGPVSSPPLDGQAGAVDASTAPVHGIGPAQAVEQNAMQPFPDAGGLPFAQPSQHVIPEPQPIFCGSISRQAALQHKQNAAQRRPVRE